MIKSMILASALLFAGSSVMAADSVQTAVVAEKTVTLSVPKMT